MSTHEDLAYAFQLAVDKPSWQDALRALEPHVLEAAKKIDRLAEQTTTLEQRVQDLGRRASG